MKFVTTRELRLRPGDVWKAVEKNGEVVITSKGKPFALLTAVKENTFEEELDAVRTARALRALDHIHDKSALRKADAMTEAEIQKEIRAVRKGRGH